MSPGNDSRDHFTVHGFSCTYCIWACKVVSGWTPRIRRSLCSYLLQLNDLKIFSLWRVFRTRLKCILYTLYWVTKVAKALWYHFNPKTNEYWTFYSLQIWHLNMEVGSIKNKKWSHERTLSLNVYTLLYYRFPSNKRIDRYKELGRKAGLDAFRSNFPSIFFCSAVSRAHVALHGFASRNQSWVFRSTQGSYL